MIKEFPLRQQYIERFEQVSLWLELCRKLRWELIGQSSALSRVW